MATLAHRPEWKEDVLVKRFCNEIQPQLDAAELELAPLLQLQPGDGVRHSAFGQGMVLSVRPMGGDALVEVAFDRVGTKRLMLKAAGAHLTKL